VCVEGGLGGGWLHMVFCCRYLSG